MSEFNIYLVILCSNGVRHNVKSSSYYVAGGNLTHIMDAFLQREAGKPCCISQGNTGGYTAHAIDNREVDDFAIRFGTLNPSLDRAIIVVTSSVSLPMQE